MINTFVIPDQRRRHQQASTILLGLLAVVAFLGFTFMAIPARAPDASPEYRPSITTGGIDDPMPYGIVYPLPIASWAESDRLEIRQRLEQIRSLGVNTVIQVFDVSGPGTGDTGGWLIFLDEAQRAGMKVVARLSTDPRWVWTEFDLREATQFLSVTADHSALIAFLGLHEPLERYTSEQLRIFYRDLKATAPEMPVAHFMIDMAWFEANPEFPGRIFSEGICDICITWYYPIRTTNGVDSFAETKVRQVLSTNRALIDERAPHSQLWFLGQAFGQSGGTQSLRMPTPEEMERLYHIVAEEGGDGFLWYPWFHNSYTSVLGDPEMTAQQDAVGAIYLKYLAPYHIYLPVFDCEQSGECPDRPQ